MNKNVELVSNCHKVEVWPKKDLEAPEGKTFYFGCPKCGKPCDAVTKENRKSPAMHLGVAFKEGK